MQHTDGTRSHGLTEANLFGLREYIRGYCLVDITNTGVLAQYKRDLPRFIDNANQIVDNEATWNRSRNQQRNWETLTQLMGMITQPTILQVPKRYDEQDLSSLGFGGDITGSHTVWTFTIGAEQTGVFNTDRIGGRLLELCQDIPVIAGLKETANLNPSTFITDGPFTNLYFDNVSF